MNDEIAYAVILTLGDVDAGGRGGPLVGPHRQHLLAEHAPAQTGHEQAQGHHDAQEHEAEHRAGHLAVEPAEPGVGAEPDAEQLGLLDRRAGAAGAPPAVGEPELLDRHDSGQRDHGQAHPAHAQRRHADHQADHHCRGRPDQRPPREPDAGLGRSMCETANPATPASVTWASDTWPTNPVITTSDRHTTIPTIDTISAWR